MSPHPKQWTEEEGNDMSILNKPIKVRWINGLSVIAILLMFGLAIHNYNTSRGWIVIIIDILIGLFNLGVLSYSLSTQNGWRLFG